MNSDILGELDIDVGADSEHISTVQKTLNDLKSVSMTHQNARPFIDKINNQIDIIDSHIENGLLRHRKTKSEYNDWIEKNQTELGSMLESKIVPVELHDILDRKYAQLQEIISWRSYQYELVYFMFKKLSEAIGAVRALDIEREATARFSQISKEQTDFMKSVLVEKQGVIDGRLDNFRKAIDEKFNIIENQLSRVQKEQFLMIQHGLEVLAKSHQNSTEAVVDAISEVVSKNIAGSIDRSKMSYAQETPKYAEPVIKTKPIESFIKNSGVNISEEEALCTVEGCDKIFTGEDAFTQLENHLKRDHTDWDNGGD